MNLFLDLIHRIRLSWAWIAGQFLGVGLLVVLALTWTRLPEKHLWQVALTLIVPILLAISALELQAGTMRRLAGGDDGKRVKLVWGAALLLVWIAVLWLSWAIFDWADAQIPQWASYLNSQAGASSRATFLTYDHLQHWMSILVWILRWIVVPGELIVYAAATAISGWRFPHGRVLRMLFDWRWWLGVIPMALLGVLLPSHFFVADPHGTPHEQIVRVILKLSATYLLAVLCWVLILAWQAVLFARQPQPASEAIDQQIFRRLWAGRKWVAAVLGWMLLSVVASLANKASSENRLVAISGVVILIPLGIFILVALIRALMGSEARSVHLKWALLSELLWIAVLLAITSGLSLWYSPIGVWVAGSVLEPGLLFPLVAASAVWALRIPWKRVGRIAITWRWWLGIFWFVFVADALPGLITAALRGDETSQSLWRTSLQGAINGILTSIALCVLLALLAVLFARQQNPPADES